jgi:hypothetical protein
VPRRQISVVSAAGGSPPKPLKAVTAHFRNTLAVRLGEIERALDIAPSQSKVVPLTVTLEDKALAKSHRPTELFNSRTCPVIGAGKPGQLYVKGTPNGVAALKRLIKEGDPDRRAPVYDEMAAMLRARFQTQNLILRPTVRVQTKAS